MENKQWITDGLVEIKGTCEFDGHKELCGFPCKEFIKEVTLKIPEQKPDIEQLAKILIDAEIISHKVIHTPEGYKVVFQGKIIKKLFYVADVPEQSVHAAKFEIPFCEFIKLPGHMHIKDLKVLIEDVSTLVLDPRTVSECILIFVCVIPHSDC